MTSGWKAGPDQTQAADTGNAVSKHRPAAQIVRLSWHRPGRWQADSPRWPRLRGHGAEPVFASAPWFGAGSLGGRRDADEVALGISEVADNQGRTGRPLRPHRTGAAEALRLA
jgi:hypothetical protein